MSYPPYPGTSEPADYPSYPTTPQAPGGYPPPSPGYYAPVREPEPARGLMIASIVFAALLTVLEVVEAAVAWPAQSTFMDAADQGLYSYDVWTPYDFTTILYLPVGIAAYIVTCLWLYKVRTNAEAIFPGAHHARSKGWVWGGWICPIVNLWFPFQIVRDIARDPREVVGSAVVGWWWAFWLLSSISAQIGSRLVGFNDIDKGLVSALGTVETINALITVVAFVLWITIVRKIGRDQDRLMHIAR